MCVCVYKDSTIDLIVHLGPSAPMPYKQYLSRLIIRSFASSPWRRVTNNRLKVLMRQLTSGSNLFYVLTNHRGGQVNSQSKGRLLAILDYYASFI